jgi:hypothetical protein
MLVAALAILPTRSGAEERSATYRAFAAQPGAELSQRTERGEEVYVARYRGVVLEERVREGRVQTFTNQRQIRSDPRACQNPTAALLVVSFLREPREARRGRVTEHLSVPRPPAAAPCL